METVEFVSLFILGALFGGLIVIFTGISGNVTGEIPDCPVCQSGNACVFQQKEASFERSGSDINNNGLFKGDAHLSNKIKNIGNSKALFNLHAKCRTLSIEEDVYSGWEYISPGELKELTAKMNTGLGEDWTCNFINIESIDVENSCNLIQT